MLYELRIYDTMPGKLPMLNERFAKHTIGFFKKHDIGILGFWTSEIGTSNRLTYILTFDSMGDREKKWGAFQADPGWQRVRAETERDGPINATVRNTFMRLTPYSPEPRIRSNVQELRIYEAVPGKLQALHDRFANHTTGFFKKYGMEVVGYWTEDVGTSNQLVYMLGYPSLGDREKSWAAFAADPEWQKVVADSHRDGVLVRHSHNTILRPTAYSPRD
jgi:hypothetical protein